MILFICCFCIDFYKNKTEKFFKKFIRNTNLNVYKRVSLCSWGSI